MANDTRFRFMNAVHRAVRSLTFGRVGNDVMGMPVLELTTTGRRSGQPRSCFLTAPVQRGDSYIVVASRGGDDTMPAWFLNLKANPDVMVSLRGGPAQPWTARVLPDDERDALWPELTSSYPNYAGYQRKTARTIPLVELTPQG
ncbi:nitroreductase family deazaflavin-dependent oxidoreductase [Epidermidibacterium keratini]|uniref:Nitroreductase family deazaflavin-dependent oxidoreductase n=1 Tax=Epidermidibacterium keratini TaxID=1891644 RepID=A0A7L4YSH2_9ACTN|nr:nitroreductase/quinone reductase family protein [Epidermidibacterium keratini]QHC01854.1 nitroreductase family deazaflavin-dependent oxidoreductase [Epidermidibacterium keratini]